MKKIILIESKWDINSAALQYALKVSKGMDTEIAGIFLASDSGSEAVEKAEEILQKARKKFVSAGIGFSSSVAPRKPDAFMKLIDDLMPASLVLIGDTRFSDEMKRGGVSVETLKEKLSCPVTSAEALASAHTEKKPAKGTNWGMWILYATGSALLYGVFYSKIEMLNEKIFMTETVLGGIAIMVAVAIHAWIWGNTTTILPKIFRLEKW